MRRSSLISNDASRTENWFINEINIRRGNIKHEKSNQKRKGNRRVWCLNNQMVGFHGLALSATINNNYRQLMIFIKCDLFKSEHLEGHIKASNIVSWYKNGNFTLRGGNSKQCLFTFEPSLKERCSIFK